MLPKIVFLFTFLVSAVLYGLLCSFLVAVSEVKDLTAAQYGMSLAYGLLLSLWLGAEAGFLVFRSQPRYTSTASEDEEAASAEKVRASEAHRRHGRPPDARRARSAPCPATHASHAPARGESWQRRAHPRVPMSVLRRVGVGRLSGAF
eukprot:3646735-Prymnesium_polylepis.2